MPHRRLAIIAAMSRELAPLLRGVQRQRADGVEFFELKSAVVAVGGIGRDAATRATEAAIARYAPSMIVSAGIAGALSRSLKLGDVVQAGEVVDVNSAARFSSMGGKAVVATASSVSGPTEKRALAARWNADVVDMEAAAVAAVAQDRRIDFAAIKAVSDELDSVMPPLGEFVGVTGKFKTLHFAAYIAIRPKWWAAVRELGLHSRVAAVNLSGVVQHLIDQQSVSVEKEKIAEV